MAILFSQIVNFTLTLAADEREYELDKFVYIWKSTFYNVVQFYCVQSTRGTRVKRESQMSFTSTGIVTVIIEKCIFMHLEDCPST
jgi:hypothetical protein